RGVSVQHRGRRGGTDPGRAARAVPRLGGRALRTGSAGGQRSGPAANDTRGTAAGAFASLKPGRLPSRGSPPIGSHGLEQSGPFGYALYYNVAEVPQCAAAL